MSTIGPIRRLRKFLIVAVVSVPPRQPARGQYAENPDEKETDQNPRTGGICHGDHNDWVRSAEKSDAYRTRVIFWDRVAPLAWSRTM